MRVALTGTPGTGKSAVGRVLARRGFAVLSVGDEAVRSGAARGRDPARGSIEVDVRALERALAAHRAPRGAPLILEGHLAHFMRVDRAVVLRCPPALLARRLRRRGWNERKVRENACAEAVGVVVTEAVHRLGRSRVWELSTEGSTAALRAGDVARIATRGGRRGLAGRIDYLEEAPRWC